MGFSKNWAIQIHNEQMQDAEYAARYEADRREEEAQYYAAREADEREQEAADEAETEHYAALEQSEQREDYDYDC
jgi:leucyl aminopeptidase (aminopeptidase T)